jgi:hypothetical protein
VSGAGVTVETHRATSTSQGCLQAVNLGLRLEFVRLCEVTEVGCSRTAVVAGPGPIEDDDGTDVLKVSDRELQREEGAQRETYYRKAVVGLAGTLGEEP